MIYLIFVALTTAIINAFIDNHQIKKHWGKLKHLNYVSRKIIRFSIFITSSLLLTKGWFILLAFILQSCIFWLVFDLLLNYLRQLPLLYLGKGAWIDRMSANYKGIVMLLFKSLLIVVTIVLWSYLKY